MQTLIGVEIEERGERLVIRAVRSYGVGGVIELREAIGGTVVLALVSILGFFFLGPASLLLGLLLGVLTALAMGSARRYLPPLVIGPRYVRPSTGLEERVRTQEIRQLYVVEKRISFKGESMVEGLGALWALLRNGQRVCLLATLPDPGTALDLEVLIEQRLGLLDVDVHGAPGDVRGDDRVALPERCASCGAGVEAGSADEDRGVVTCGSCQSLTLLWPKDDQRPVLGHPGRFPLVWEVEATDDAVRLARFRRFRAGRRLAAFALWSLAVLLATPAGLMLVGGLVLGAGSLSLVAGAVAGTVACAAPGLLFAWGASALIRHVRTVARCTPEEARVTLNVLPFVGPRLRRPRRVSVQSRTQPVWRPFGQLTEDMATSGKTEILESFLPRQEQRLEVRVHDQSGRSLVLASGIRAAREAFDVAAQLRVVLDPRDDGSVGPASACTGGDDGVPAVPRVSVGDSGGCKPRSYPC